MRLFISYARVDKYFCSQIVDMLDVHEIWFDNQLQAGQQWWAEIRRQLEWCDGFVYLLSQDSVESKYCKQEFVIAKALGKHIIPILIQADTPIPQDLAHIHYADLSKGITSDAVKMILDSIYLAERQKVQEKAPVAQPMPFISVDEPTTNFEVESLIADAAEAFDGEEYDRTVYLLKQAEASGYQSRFIDLKAMLHQAEDALEWQAYRKEAEREYNPIAALVKHKATRKLGCQAFNAFSKNFSDFDPEDLASICLEMTEWCQIPAGEVRIKRSGKVKTYQVNEFEIGKYPVTNAQYVEFLEAPDGYSDPNWWNYSAYALNWRQKHSEGAYPMPVGQDHPCVNVCWYEAVAYCRWLSHKTGKTISLPTEQQWLRTAQGDDGRLFPWGNKFDPDRCNTKETGMRQTTPVTHFDKGVSPYGVYDMAGNVWEWCVNNEQSGSERNTSVDEDRVIKGGAYISPFKRASSRFYYSLNPQCRYQSIGFRLVCLKD